MNMTDIDTTVFVFNRNGSDSLKRCMDGLASQSYKKFKTIFVDDFSDDDSVEKVKRLYPGVKILQMKKNFGIAAAQQKAYSGADTKYIASLHIDAVPDKDWLKELVSTIESSDEDVACAQSTVRQRSGVLDGSVNVISSNVVNIYKKRKEKFYAGTAAMIMKNGVTRKYCDPEYFFYLEDMYLGWLLRLKGYKIVRCFKSKVYHKGTHSGRDKKTMKKYHFLYERNRIMNFFTFYEASTIVKLLPIFVMGSKLKFINSLFGAKWKIIPQIKAGLWFFSNMKKIMSKRASIQSMRKVKDAEITKEMTSVLSAGSRGIDSFVNDVSRGYCKAVGVKTLEDVIESR